MPTSVALESDSDQVEHALPLAAARPAAARSAIPAVDTPVMRQYLEIKERYPDCILFFRLGDFYEMFFDDAVEASQLLDLTLTARDKQKEVPVPMCGVPYHAARGYIGRLIAQGRKVAICDQMEDAKKAKKIVRRAVTQVVTTCVRCVREVRSRDGRAWRTSMFRRESLRPVSWRRAKRSTSCVGSSPPSCFWSRTSQRQRRTSGLAHGEPKWRRG